ncbi:tetratricopeptide repeat protein [Cohnella pontilimi]|uniref:Tetratricopeptide repeat protein n=1 Tax=Cohnella pontilimi TaxID=2564100 RepID=A0A4U0FGX1_9BACL|nr:tetratricopeptide repeat protein [Cohnella pontilimi]TJY44181.1 tetratricopeptide repeat protein [Cohnella pontilimi]
MFRYWARWMAHRSWRKGQRNRALRWFRQAGTSMLTPQDQVRYAGLLHESGDSDQALRILNALLLRNPDPAAHERRAHIFSEMGRDAEAIADLNEAIRLDPEPSMYWYARAIAHNEQGAYELAARDFTEALSRNDDTKISTYFELGSVYMKLGKIPEAEACYRLAAEDPELVIPHYHHRHAMVLEAMNRDEEALEAVRKAVRLYDTWRNMPDRGASEIKRRTNYSPAGVRSFLQGAEEEYGFRLYESRLLEKMECWDEALDALEAALSIYPGAAELLLRKGIMLRQSGRPQEAEKLFQDLKFQNPVWLPAYLELCTTYRQLEQADDAISILHEAKAHFPDNMIIRYWLADALREADRLEEARIENRFLTELEPGDPLNWKQKAEIAIDSDRYEEAVEAYTKAIELDDKADYYMRRSFTRYMIDRYEEAMMDIQAAVERDASLLLDSKTSYAMGELYTGMENWEMAEAEYSRAIATEPDNPQLYERRARCRNAADKLAEAIEDCNKGLALDASNARLLWLRGYLYYRMDEYEAALTDSLAYLLLRPVDPKGHYNMGLIYKQLSRWDDAIRSFTKVLELNPFEPQAYLERAKIRYHHSFDRINAADDLAQWLIYAGSTAGPADKTGPDLLAELPGFDDEMRQRAIEQFRNVYESGRYLS